jgi:hypothetical protein
MNRIYVIVATLFTLGVYRLFQMFNISRNEAAQAKEAAVDATDNAEVSIDDISVTKRQEALNAAIKAFNLKYPDIKLDDDKGGNS